MIAHSLGVAAAAVAVIAVVGCGGTERTQPVEDGALKIDARSQ